MDLDVELKVNNDSERQTEDMVLNAKMKMWLWTPKWRCDFERQNEDAALKANWKKGMMAMNAALKTNNGSKRQNETTALNAKLKKQLWMLKWKCGSKR